MKPEVFIVMGVSGAGKTRLGRALANELGWDFIDADDYHSSENVAKMRAGAPLTDDDRAPWLASLRAEIERALTLRRPLVLACSALKQGYRDTLRGDDDARIRFLWLDGSRTVLADRLAARAGHYMPPTLLASQLEALEPPQDALRIDIALTTDDQIAAVRNAFGV